MLKDDVCIECGRPYPEEHHIIFRKQQKAMEKCPHNILHLCYEHHRGSKSSPHMVKAIDLKYKRQLQEKLESLFSGKEIYSEEEIKDILLIPKRDTRKLLKPLCIQIVADEVGYISEDIIKQCLGGKFYI